MFLDNEGFFVVEQIHKSGSFITDMYLEQPLDGMGILYRKIKCDYCHSISYLDIKEDNRCKNCGAAHYNLV